MNYFELFGIKESPNVDKHSITKKYFELQRESHPDRHTQSGDWEQEKMLAFSASINQAYAVFRDEQRTLEYFLKMKGWVGDEEKYQLPGEFLMEMMDVNELLEEEGGEKCRQMILEKVKENDEQIGKLLLKDVDTYDDAEKDELVGFYYKKKYLKRLLDRLAD